MFKKRAAAEKGCRPFYLWELQIFKKHLDKN
jgi:hypothetical protein